jgi:hypothetical protein
VKPGFETPSITVINVYEPQLFRGASLQGRICSTEELWLRTAPSAVLAFWQIPQLAEDPVVSDIGLPTPSTTGSEKGKLAAMANPNGFPGSYPRGAAYPPSQVIVEPPYLTREDAEQLHLLRIGYYVVGGGSALASLFPLLYVGLGAWMAMGGFASSSSKGAPPPPLVGWIVIVIGVFATAAIASMAVLSLLAAGALRARRQRTFVMVVGALHLMHAPLGTLLGVFSLLVLQRPSVRATFETNSLALANQPRKME